MNTTHNLFSVVILAGGLATRLRPLTTTLPKSLIDIHGKPFIEHQLRLLEQNNIRHVVLCLGFLGDKVIDYLENNRHSQLKIDYVLDGSVLLGTGGAIKKALPHVDDTFFVLYGDSYLPCDYAAIQYFYMTCHKKGLMTVFHNSGKWDTSNVEYSAGQILAYDKINRTEQMHYIDYGLSIMHKNAFSSVTDQEPFDLSLIHQNLLKANELAGYEVANRFYEVGSQSGIAAIKDYLQQDNI